MSALDRIDLEILKILQKDSRKSISEIAEILDLSRPTRKRIKKMLDMSVIKRFTVLVDDNVVRGIKVIYRFISKDPENLLDYLKDRNEFIEVYLTGGEKNEM